MRRAACSRPRAARSPDDGGYRVSGRWPFASGCEHCRLADGRLRRRGRRRPRMLPNGMPDVRLLLAPAAEFTIHDTWHVIGPARHRQPRHRARGAITSRPSAAPRCSRDPPVQPGPLYALPAVRPARGGDRGGVRSASRAARSTTSSRWPARKVPDRRAAALAERATVQAEVARAEAALRRGARVRCSTTRSARAWEQAVGDGERRRRAARAALRLAATHATAHRRRGGRDRLPARRRQRDLRVQPAAAPLPRRARRHAAHARRARRPGS